MAVLRHPAGLRGTALVQRRRPARPGRSSRHHPPRRHHPRHHQSGQSVPLRHAGRATGDESEIDRSDDLVAAFQASGFDALVSIGGDGSLQISHQLWCKGLPVVCVPKTIDNDVSGTQRTLRLRQRGEHRDRGARQGPLHRGEPRPGHGGGADGALRRLDRALQRTLGQRRRDPAAGDPLRHREGVRQDPGAGSRGAAVQHRRGGRGGATQRRGDRAGRAARGRHGGPARRHREQGGAGDRASAPGRRPGRWCSATCSGAARPTTYDRLLALRFGGRPCGRSRTARSARWWGSTGPTSPGCPSPRWSAGPRTCRSTATSSRRLGSWGSAWEIDAGQRGAGSGSGVANGALQSSLMIAIHLMISYPPTRTSDALRSSTARRIPDPYRWLEDGESADTRTLDRAPRTR